MWKAIGMSLGIKNSARLIEALCEVSCIQRYPLCINAATAKKLNLPDIGHRHWERIVVHLAKAGIACFKHDYNDGYTNREIGYIVIRPGVILQSSDRAENLIKVFTNPEKYYPKKSLTGEDISAGTSQKALEAEENFLRIAAECCDADRAGALLNCAMSTEKAIDRLNTLRYDILEKVKFQERCDDVKLVHGYGMDFEDINRMESVRVCSLLQDLVNLDFPRTKAIGLIAQSTNLPEHTIRDWTSYVKKNAATLGDVKV